MANSSVFKKIDEILERINKTIDDVDVETIKPLEKNQETKKPKEFIYSDEESHNGFQIKPLSNNSMNSFSFRKDVPEISTPTQIFHPRINKKSIEIAKKLGSPMSRLLETPEKQKLCETASFRPLIKKRSEKILQKYEKNTQNRWEILYEQSIQQRLKIEAARKVSQENEMNDKECTFRPVLSTSGKNSEDIITRSSNWLKLKNKKISMKVEADLDRDLKECTFAPRILEFKSDSNDRPEEIKGLKLFLFRQTSAKRLNSKKPEGTPKRKMKSRDLTPKQYLSAVSALSDYLHSIDI